MDPGGGIAQQRQHHHHRVKRGLSGQYYPGKLQEGMRSRANDEEYFYGGGSTGLRRSSSTRRSSHDHHHHHHHTCPQYKASNAGSGGSSQPRPGRVERTNSGARFDAAPSAPSPAAAQRSSAVPGYQQDTLSSVRRSRERAAASPAPPPPPAAANTASRRSASAAGSVRLHRHLSGNNLSASSSSNRAPLSVLLNSHPSAPVFRYENESAAPSSNRGSYHQRQQQQHHASKDKSDTNNNSNAYGLGYASPEDLVRIPRTHYQHHHSRSNNHPHPQRKLSRNGSMNSVVSHFGTVSAATAGSLLGQEQKYRCMGGNSNNNPRNLLRTFSFRDKPPNPDLFSSMPCLNNGGNLASISRPSNNIGGSGTSSNYPPSLNGNSNRLNHQHSSTPTSSSLVLNSLAYQILPMYHHQQQQQNLPPPPPPPGQQNSSKHGKSTSGFAVGSLSSLSHHSSSTNVARSSGGSSSGGNPNGGSTSPPLTQPPQPPPQRPLRPVRRPVADDADGHLAYLPGDVLGDRYEVLSGLGEGTFGKVAKCRDLRTGATVATKIIKNIHKYREAAKLEVNVLRKLNAKDPNGRFLCVRMFDAFNYYGHMCLTFEVLGESVFDFLKSNGYAPYPMRHVRHIIHQLCLAVAFMHDNKVTHTDLKPENILFVSRDCFVDESAAPGNARHAANTKGGGSGGGAVRRMRDTRVKLIDFGSATFEWEHHSTVVSTRHYRAPEVILELGWSHPCDVWSIGCIMFELYHGYTLFQTHDNREHLAMMEKILDKPMPNSMVKRTKTKFFDRSTHRLLWDVESPEARYTNQNCRPLRQYRLRGNGSNGGSGRSRRRPTQEETEAEQSMYDLAMAMLEYDPVDRLVLREAAAHPYFAELRQRPNLAVNEDEETSLAFGEEDEDDEREEGESAAAAAARNRRMLLDEGTTAAHILRLQI